MQHNDSPPVSLSSSTDSALAPRSSSAHQTSPPPLLQTDGIESNGSCLRGMSIGWCIDGREQWQLSSHFFIVLLSHHLPCLQVLCTVWIRLNYQYALLARERQRPKLRWTTSDLGRSQYNGVVDLAAFPIRFFVEPIGYTVMVVRFMGIQWQCVSISPL
jgi:hypothetical protein